MKIKIGNLSMWVNCRLFMEISDQGFWTLVEYFCAIEVWPAIKHWISFWYSENFSLGTQVTIILDSGRGRCQSLIMKEKEVTLGLLGPERFKTPKEAGTMRSSFLDLEESLHMKEMDEKEKSFLLSLHLFSHHW